MAIHPDTASMLRESLAEYLLVAGWCVDYRKDGAWGADQIGGRLGYPAAVMLFCIADTIGSFHRGDKQFSARVDGRSVLIRRQGFQHFYVLNSDYYGQSLSEAAIKRLYGNFRDLLVHNAALAPEHALVSQPEIHAAFPVVDDRLSVNIDGFLAITRPAVERFLERVPTLVPPSQQGHNIRQRR